MKTHFKHFTHIILLSAILTSCGNYRKLLTDEIVFTDGSSQTGTIIQSDQNNIKIKKIDESISILPWSIVDTVQGKKYKTFWMGVNIGYYNTPYFSVFRNEAINAKQFGMQYKIGLALRGNRLYYFNLSYSPAKPYSITKFGLGYQRYLGISTYLKKNSFFGGAEFNFMNVEFNNGPQMILEPFTGFERKLNEHLRVNFKLALQFNLANKNNQTGVNATIGIHFLSRNFKKYYETINKEHRIPYRVVRK